MADELVRAVKGMNDVLPSAEESFLDTVVWDALHDSARRILEGAGYRHVHLPAVEETALFARGIGEATDVVSKEMYSFEDRGGRRLTLRPEGTAGAVRAYVEHSLGKKQALQRWWYAGPMFRAERPQKGRYRQFYQIGAELLGSAAPLADAELIALLWRWCSELGLAGITPKINSLGDQESRAAYRAALLVYLRAHEAELCEACRERLGTNPLRVLDCKREGCRRVIAHAPEIEGSLSAASAAHYREVQALLGDLGVPVQKEPRLVRGLDYYTGTLFEFTTSALGAQDAILGGGRYDELVESLGGPPTPAIGFSAGVERLAHLVAPRLLGEGLPAGSAATRHGAHLLIAPMPGMERRALGLAEEVRRHGPWRVELDVVGGKVKQQLARADKSGARAVLVLGDSEGASGRGKIKDLVVGSEQETELTGAAVASVLGRLAGATDRTE